jgi:glucosylceramidase
MVDTATEEIYVHDSYYYIGHFSKYVKKGAKRIGSSKWTHELDTVSFKNPDGSIVSVVLNMTDNDVPACFYMNGEAVETTMQPHSIATFIFE